MNEYEILETIGKGSFSKIKKVKRFFINENDERVSAIYCFKVFNKYLLGKKRYIKYVEADVSKMTTYLD